MLIRTKYAIQLLSTPVFCRVFKMPYWAVVIKPSNSAAIADNWTTAQTMVEVIADSYSKKFDTKIEAEKYVTDLNCQIIKGVDYETRIINKIIEENEKKRKHDEQDADKQIKKAKTLIKDHIKKVKMSFNALQVAIATVPELPPTCAEEIQTLNDKVAFKLSKILKVKPKLAVNDVARNKRHVSDETDRHPNPGPSTTSESNLDYITNSILSKSDKELAVKSFSYNDKNEVIVYTDGSCTNNGTSEALAGAGVWFGMNHILNMSVKVPGMQTNNCAEIYAAVHALERVKASGLNRINIRTDSNFIIKAVNEWVIKWKVNGWKTAGGSEVKNKELFVVLLQSVESMESCTWTYVPAHKGIKGNEEADKLAKAGTKL